MVKFTSFALGIPLENGTQHLFQMSPKRYPGHVKIIENGTWALPAAPQTGSGAVVGCECAPGERDPTPPDTIFEQNVQTWGHFGRPLDARGLDFGRR